MKQKFENFVNDDDANFSLNVNLQKLQLIEQYDDLNFLSNFQNDVSIQLFDEKKIVTSIIFISIIVTNFMNSSSKTSSIVKNIFIFIFHQRNYYEFFKFEFALKL